MHEKRREIPEIPKISGDAPRASTLSAAYLVRALFNILIPRARLRPRLVSDKGAGAAHALGCAMSKNTSEQHFRDLYNMSNDEAASQNERDKAERAWVAWLKRRGKARRDIGAILLQAAKDDEKAKLSSPAPDPRDSAPHPYDDPQFTPVGWWRAWLKNTCG